MDSSIFDYRLSSARAALVLFTSLFPCSRHVYSSYFDCWWRSRQQGYPGMSLEITLRKMQCKFIISHTFNKINKTKSKGEA